VFKTFATAKVQQNFEICKKNQKNDIFEAKNLEISRKSCIFAAYFEETNQSQIFLSRYRLFVRVTMDEARFEHPLSTLSASIEHPLEPGGDQVL